METCEVIPRAKISAACAAANPGEGAPNNHIRVCVHGNGTDLTTGHKASGIWKTGVLVKSGIQKRRIDRSGWEKSCQEGPPRFVEARKVAAHKNRAIRLHKEG